MRVSRGGTFFPPDAVAPALSEPAFRGRTEELAHLRLALGAIERGTPARILVIGEQGIGKSRLVAEALAAERHRGFVLFAGGAAEFESDRPFGALIDALDLHPHSRSPQQAAIAELIAMAARAGGDAEQRHEVAMRIAELVRRRSEVAPVAILIEDVQWADRHTVASLAQLIALSTDVPLGIVLTRRMLPLSAPVDELFEHGRPRFQRVDLDALDPEITALLAHDVLGVPPGPRLQQQIDDTGGNPAMLLALLEGSRLEGSLQCQGAVIETESVAAPASIRPAILTRIARLSDRCQDLLTVAAVFERPFGVATLAAVARRSVIEVLTDLREALGARLLLEVAGVLSFRHQMVRRILYEATPATVRGELHAQISSALDDDRGSPELVVHHRRRAIELRGQPGETSWPARQQDRLSLPWDRLTKSEREVALLAAHGLSNKQLGVRMHVSARTIETHLAHVYAKLGLHSRVELAAEVARARIPEPDGELMILGRAVTAPAGPVATAATERRHRQ